jgi:hypothetical protein
MSKKENMYVASCISGCLETFLTSPLDRIKTEKQIETLEKSKKNIKTQTSFLNTIETIYTKNNGIRGFYVGIMPRLIGIIPMRLTYWTTMTTTSDYVYNNKKQIEKEYSKYIPQNGLNIIMNIIPGIMTGMAQSIIDNPIEVAKIKLMSNGKSEIKISNMYQGFGYLMTRNIIFAIPVAYSIKNYGNENPFIAGAVGGLIGSIISHPFDVIKTERQRYIEKDNNTKITIRSMIKKNPIGLFSGLTMRCSLSFLNMGIGSIAFNYFYNRLNEYINYD